MYIDGSLTIIGTADSPIKIGDVKIGGTDDENVDYIEFDNNDIIQNGEKIIEAVTETSKYKDLIKVDSPSTNIRNKNIGLSVLIT